MVHGGRVTRHAEDSRLRGLARFGWVVASAAPAVMVALLAELSPFACLTLAVLAAGSWSWWLEGHPDPDAGSGRGKVVSGLHRLRHRELGLSVYWLPKSFRALPNDTGEPREVPPHLEGRIRIQRPEARD